MFRGRHRYLSVLVVVVVVALVREVRCGCQRVKVGICDDQEKANQTHNEE